MQIWERVSIIKASCKKKRAHLFCADGEGQKELHCFFMFLEKGYDKKAEEGLWYCIEAGGGCRAGRDRVRLLSSVHQFVSGILNVHITTCKM